MATATLLARPSDEGVVERVGTCADGCCARFHCRACGHYWLGEEAEHVCGAAVPDLERTIKAWIAAELEEGEGLATCTRRVLEQVKAAGLADALLEWAIEKLWREHDDRGGEHDHWKANGVVKRAAHPSQTPSLGDILAHGLNAQLVSRNIRIEVSMAARQVSFREHQVATAADNGVAVTREHHPTRPGWRRVNVEQLANADALLECLVQVGGAWMRLGDLDKRQCKALQLEHLATADRNRRRAIAFGQLAARLHDGETVRQLWTAEQIKALVGDTLSGAASARPT
jgi:hypothetical protein